MLHMDVTDKGMQEKSDADWTNPVFAEKKKMHRSTSVTLLSRVISMNFSLHAASLNFLNNVTQSSHTVLSDKTSYRDVKYKQQVSSLWWELLRQNAGSQSMLLVGQSPVKSTLQFTRYNELHLQILKSLKQEYHPHKHTPWSKPWGFMAVTCTFAAFLPSWHYWTADTQEHCLAAVTSQ